MSPQAKINNGVRPYGGRLLDVVEVKTYPNGRVVVVVLPPATNRSRHHGLALGTRTLEYNANEVTLTKETTHGKY